jgi:hypothetical protein
MRLLPLQCSRCLAIQLHRSCHAGIGDVAFLVINCCPVEQHFFLAEVDLRPAQAGCLRCVQADEKHELHVIRDLLAAVLTQPVNGRRAPRPSRTRQGGLLVGNAFDFRAGMLSDQLVIAGELEDPRFLRHGHR